uniref:Chromosome segregation in meiosis protein 3 domain-containing protein n=1 Tax=Polytomella parva TaxID=51329 RepID=A0A7S0YUT4_9CHLO|mmetsp:Transcript_9960/g.18533  ORF Transcript_9960/g.18533 Transcript_9960/m.18533 type:complete len:397 (+) Transcript_9960:98-1288(+)|eukprot:CAMPEP_0175057062 /NCGR_PEP_ID=MMETSP0052_2-20121109/11042_1 /TAXON_ID=51329 ORGANISM="Polytomella parva, Strain SAG 63-3" /NCGR_SAMPLE_ID=MMETSP0052_2 /ASSEMBLY_ACC=CAM_ASM_000194 /LENGTH=396 /DNA_ID=CAMNT_0016322207 /DNA_START=89 /DNA_END=1279 /DNA_ORIENTATION=+
MSSFRKSDAMVRQHSMDSSSRSQSESIASTRNIPVKRSNEVTMAPRLSHTGIISPHFSPGHSSRNASSSTTAAAATRQLAHITSHDDERASASAVALDLHPEGPPPKKKRQCIRTPIPKLDMDLLKTEKGLPDVFYKFPEEFRSRSLGVGHEVEDLRLLLGMFSRWHRRLFPHVDFDTFIAKSEKLGSTSIGKNELRAMRANLLSAMDPDPVPEIRSESTSTAPVLVEPVRTSKPASSVAQPATAASVSSMAGTAAPVQGIRPGSTVALSPSLKAASSAAAAGKSKEEEDADEADDMLLQLMQGDYDDILDELEVPDATVSAPSSSSHADRSRMPCPSPHLSPNRSAPATAPPLPLPLPLPHAGTEERDETLFDELDDFLDEEYESLVAENPRPLR